MDTPQRRETGRPPAAQFAPRAVYIQDGNATGSGKTRRSGGTACSATTSAWPARPGAARAYIAELMPDLLNGTIEPGKVFDASTSLDGVPAAYQDMADRRVLKVPIRP